MIIKKPPPTNIIISLILVVAFIIRLNLLDYPLANEETNRDFLVARHIVKYQEYPLTGPRNGALPHLGNSPVYYYILSFLISIIDSQMFVSTVNLVAQMFTIVIIYFVTKGLFSKETAVLTTLLISVSTIFVMTSIWSWQPYAMYFFIVCCYLLLFLYYKHKKFIFLVTACLFLLISTKIHMSAFATIPGIILAILLITPITKKGVKTIFIVLSLLVIVVIPVLKLGFKIPTDLWIPFAVLNNAFFTNFSAANVIFFGLPILYLFVISDKSRKSYLLLFIFVILFLISSSTIGNQLLKQHLYPIYPIVVILFSESLVNLLPHSKKMMLVKIFVVIFLLVSLTQNVSEKKSNFPFEKLQAANTISIILASEIKRVSQEESLPLNFFEINVYAPKENYWWYGNDNIINSIYWVLIENRLNEKFTKTERGDLESSFSSISSDNYRIIICVYYDNPEGEMSDCLPRFLQEHKNYIVQKRIQNTAYQHVFYLAKRVN